MEELRNKGQVTHEITSASGHGTRRVQDQGKNQGNETSECEADERDHRQENQRRILVTASDSEIVDTKLKESDEDIFIGKITRDSMVPEKEIHFKHPATGKLLGKIVNVGTPEERIEYGCT